MNWSLSKFFWLIGGLLVVVMGTIVVTSPKPFFYDEPTYLNHVGYLHQYGWSKKFLFEYPGYAGPLHSTLHYFLEPLTKFQPIVTRLVNVVLLLGTICLVRCFLKFYTDEKHKSLVALSLLSIPILWPISGMALTEMPSIFCLTLSLGLMTVSFQTDQRSIQIVIGLLGGVFLSLAVIGRQTMLPLLVIPLLFGVLFPKRIVPILSFFIGFAPLALIVFGAWGGINSPIIQAEVARLDRDFALSPVHALLSYGYAFFIAFLFCPSYFMIPRIPLVVSIILGIVSKNLFQFKSHLPMQGLLNDILPKSVVSILGHCFSYGFSCLAVWFIIAVAWNTLKSKEWRELLPWALGLGLILGTPIAITHTFSSRYVAISVPVMVFLLANFWTPRYYPALRLTIGGLLGAVMLFSWLHRGNNDAVRWKGLEPHYPELWQAEQIKDAEWSNDDWRAYYKKMKANPN